MAVSATQRDLPDCLPRLHRRQNPLGQAGDQQDCVSDSGRQYGGSQGAIGPVVIENEVSRVWLNVLTELQNRGVNDI
ncbi:MAG: hypothetical protein ACI8Z1_003077 [Candidatus Azotimanducaceae bacterium]|jgi:hypothetical protein